MTHTEVLIVGAGFAGIAAAIELRDAGHDIAIIERADRIGGTWRDNVYPGVGCDVPSELYTLSRHPISGAAGPFATGAEIQAYLERVVAVEALQPVIQTNTELQHARWDGVWQVETTGGDVRTADVLVLACGRLSEPHVPTAPGLESFAGRVVHTAAWDHAISSPGRIAVIGTGASAVQLVPELVRRGADVTLFQRSAPWILPRTAPAAGEGREELLAAAEAGYPARAGEEHAARAARRTAERHLRRQVTDGALRSALTPRYEFGCKRVLLSDTYYPAVASASVTVEPSALERVDRGALVAASGRRYDGFDTIVFATGFRAARPRYAARITGEDGITLDTHWSAGMTALAGTNVAGFPDLFLVGGPSSALTYTSSLLMIEAQLRFVRRVLDRRADTGTPVRVAPEAEAAFTSLIDERAAGSSWMSGCQNWYVDPRSGRLTVAWPGTVADYEAAIAQDLDEAFLPMRAGAVR